MVRSFLFVSKLLFIYFMYVNILLCLQTHQKRVSDPITDGWEPPCGCWELNSGPLEEQPMLLTAEPSLQTGLEFLLTFKRVFFFLRFTLFKCMNSLSACMSSDVCA